MIKQMEDEMLQVRQNIAESAIAVHSYRPIQRYDQRLRAFLKFPADAVQGSTSLGLDLMRTPRTSTRIP